MKYPKLYEHIALYQGERYRRYLPSAYDSSLSVYEQLVQMIEYMNQLGLLTNDMISSWNEFQKWFYENFEAGLQDTVEEVLNKWLETGKLDDIFQRLDEKVDTVIGITLNNTYVNDLPYRKVHYRKDGTHTTVYLTEIPRKDTDGTALMLDRGFANDEINTGKKETPRSFSDRHHSSFVMNAGVYDTTTNRMVGNQVYNKEIIRDDNPSDPSYRDYRWYLAIQDDGKLKCYANQTTNKQMIDEGAKHVITGFYPVIMDFKKADQSIWDKHKDGAMTYHPRQVIAQKKNGDYVILSCEGRLDPTIERGLNMQDVYDILIEQYDCTECDERIETAYSLDAGGSVSTVVYGTMINNPYDATQQAERPVTDFLHISKPLLSYRDRNMYNMMKNTGYVRKELSNLKSDVYQKTGNQGYIQLVSQNPDFDFYGIETWTAEADKPKVRNTKLTTAKEMIRYSDLIKTSTIFEANKVDGLKDFFGSLGDVHEFANSTRYENDINNIDKTGLYYAGQDKANIPATGTGWALIHFKIYNTLSMQVAIPTYSEASGLKIPPKRRQKFEGVWTDWQDLIPSS